MGLGFVRQGIKQNAMSTAIRERTTTRSSRKIVSHGSPISGQTQVATTANSLENNLDALLEDLQTSVSRSATPSRGGRALSPQVEYRVAANPTKVVSEGRPISPNRSAMTTTEKYVSTGPSGAASGIPGLEFIDSELQNVQPGQSKTIAYKQVSYQYNKSLDGKPVGYQTEPVEYVPVPSPTPAIPINLAPGPNTKVTTTIKTYTYELPGAPESYLPGGGGSVPGAVMLPGDQTITYTLPKGSTSATDKTVTYQTITENVPPRTPPVRYGSPTPVVDITKKSTTLHQEKFFREEHLGGSPAVQPTTVVYHPGSPESKTTIMRNEKYYAVDGSYPNGYGPGDRPDHPDQTINESHTTINRIEEHYPSSRSPSSGRYPTPDDKPGTPVNYYTSPPQTTPPQSTTTIYKFSNMTTTVPPHKNAEDHEVLLPKPFPTDGVQVCPAKPATTQQQCPPKKLEDLMASFSDTEREVLEDIQKRERVQQRESPATKKEVDFIPHSPPKVKSKNVAGPPVYYPPGSAEFTKKEESSMAMSQAGGGWQKGSAKYEYEASSKSKSQTKSGGAVVPVCLPLCCAMPCTLM
ncbi:uncharacterized protein LOC143214458 isoform X2 [Lasioglossum baleicum]|uniref:uncharacterized protein LOC143214458 isoform X2 n=1 Tax=Lasioglossum baleicum TaxID=434251 RepID=UPI003FCDD3DE